MIPVKEELEHNIWWTFQVGNSSFWFDSLTKQGALCYHYGT